MRKFYSIMFCLTLACIGACGTGGNGVSDSTVPAGETNSPAPSGSVLSKLEQTGGVAYKVYLQPEANDFNRKGIVLLGGGNEPTAPKTGGLEGALENMTARELAGQGFVAAIVAYREQPPVDFNDGGVSWNKNSQMLATDMSAVADTIIQTYGGGLSRDRVVTGGVSYTSYMLLTNISLDNTPLADTRGVLAACGSTGDFEARNFRIPIFSLNCQTNDDGDYYGQALIDRITNVDIKSQSGFFTDDSCNTHCGGTTEGWSAKLVERARIWLP